MRGSSHSPPPPQAGNNEYGLHVHPIHIFLLSCHLLSVHLLKSGKTLVENARASEASERSRMYTFSRNRKARYIHIRTNPAHIITIHGLISSITIGLLTGLHSLKLRRRAFDAFMSSTFYSLAQVRKNTSWKPASERSERALKNVYFFT